MPRCTALFLLVAFGPGTVALGAVPTYSVFELQARSNIVDGYNLPAGSSFNSKSPALNDAGSVAFTLVTVGGGDGGLFAGSGGTGAVVYTALPGRVLEDPSINAAGVCSFEQGDFFSDGIFVYDPGSGATLQRVAPTTFSTAGSTDLTDDDAIGYRAAPFGGSRSWRLHASGAETFYAAEGGGIAYLFSPSTNDARRIAGKVRLGSTAGSSPDEIRVYDGPGSFVAVAKDADANPASPFVGFDNGVQLANDGSVAFVAGLVGGGRGVFLADSTAITTIATDGDPDVSEIFYFRPAVHDLGLVAFRGKDAAGLDAIFVGDGVELRRVVGEHDKVPTDLGTARIDQHDDSVVFGGNVAINARGDVAFNAALTPENDNMVEWGSGMFVAYADGSLAPPPVPDGATIAGAQMRLARTAGDDELLVTWDTTTCPAHDYNLFSGPLDAVATLSVDGAACSLGPSGSATITTDADDRFFLLASENALGVESGHGFDGNGVARSSTGVGLCDIVEQSLEGTCP